MTILAVRVEVTSQRPASTLIASFPGYFQTAAKADLQSGWGHARGRKLSKEAMCISYYGHWVHLSRTGLIKDIGKVGSLPTQQKTVTLI